MILITLYQITSANEYRMKINMNAIFTLIKRHMIQYSLLVRSNVTHALSADNMPGMKIIERIFVENASRKVERLLILDK